MGNACDASTEKEEQEDEKLMVILNNSKFGGRPGVGTSDNLLK